HVRDGLDPASREVEVREGAFVEDPERVEPLRRDVHVAVAGKWRGGDEEHVLAPDPVGELGRDRVVLPSHQRIFAPWRGGPGPIPGASARAPQAPASAAGGEL